MYHPVWQSKFKDVVDLSDGKFRIDHNCPATKKFLASQINDNVYKNIEKFQVLFYDEEHKHHKTVFTEPEKNEIAEKLANDEKMESLLHKSVDRILLTHRNTRLFLFMMTGPFLLLMQVIKYSIKAIIFMHFYRKHKAKKALKEGEESETSATYPPVESKAE